jgi:hypothetical protein
VYEMNIVYETWDGNEWVLANIVKVQNGGIAVTGVPKNRNDQVGITPDALILQLGVAYTSQPGTPQVSVFKLSTQAKVDLIVESATKM